MELTDIAKIVRKKSFWILQMKTHKVELVKNVKKTRTRRTTGAKGIYFLLFESMSMYLDLTESISI